MQQASRHDAAVGSFVLLGGAAMLPISFDDKNFQAKVPTSLNKKVAFPKDSSARILTAGLFGEQYIGLESGTDEKNLSAGDTTKQTQSAIVLENLIGQFLYIKAADAGTASGDPKP